MEIGDRVRTYHGRGIIIGKDLPNHECWRWIVKLDNDREICCFPKNVKPVERRC